MGEEGELIQSVVNSAESFDELDVMKAWENHLEKNLQFPFKTDMVSFAITSFQT